MRDNQLALLIRSILTTGLSNIGVTADVVQNFQPSQQGVSTSPTIYVHKIMDHRRGTPKTVNKWQPSYIMDDGPLATGPIEDDNTPGIQDDGEASYVRDDNGNFVLDENGNKILSDSSPSYILDDQGNRIDKDGTNYILDENGNRIDGEGTNFVLDDNGNKIVDDSGGSMVSTTYQLYETTFQVSALSIIDPNDDDFVTASDLVNYASAILQDPTNIATMIAKEVGILKIGDLRNPYFSDDRDLNEASPSFDFVLTHKQIIVSTVPVAETTELAVYRV